MKTLTAKIFRILGSRVALNIYFWLVVLNLMINNINNHNKAYSFQWYLLFISVNLFLLIILLYTNNLLLVPRFLARKKWKTYLAILIPFSFVIAFLYTAFQKYIAKHFPLIEINQVSFISFPVSAEWKWEIVVDEVINFYFPLILLLFLFTALWYMHDYSKQKKLADELVKKQTETELFFLKSQLNPHFLFNTLNNLYGLALKKSDETPEVILKLASIMRYILYESNANLVAFDKEKEAMHAYIDLELLRIQQKEYMHFTLNADKNYQIPPLLWLPVLENVFKHGTRFITDKYFIDYKFTIKNNILEIRSENNYKTLQNSNNLNGGIGLENLKKRLELLFPGRYTIEIKNEQETYAITIIAKLA